ncbi:MAG TPA: gamma-glutamyltransferase family protein [Methylomirabilota bacterium]|nr:gamma-glutamyltransferase family protein [Methylomirabilota bacterium]
MIRSSVAVTKHTPLAPHGMVVAEHPLGADVGAGILARGGNAVDAAVATAFAMTVVEPFMSTIAGSGTMLVHLAKRGETVCLDFNAVAPLAAHETIYRVIGGISDALFPWPRVEDDANVFGHRSVAVPGSVAGLALAVERYGSMALGDVLAPAIELARSGFVHDWYLALKHAHHLEELAQFPESARTYLRHGRSIYRPPSMQPGDVARYPDLARTLELIARDGPSAFYRGAIAKAIHAEMSAHGGLLTRDDLAAYEVRVGPALHGRYRDVELAFSPGATGGTTALEILNILGEFPAAKVGWTSGDGLHVRAMATKRAFQDRFEHLGDAAVVKAPWERLVSREHARAAAAEIRRLKSAPRRRGPGPGVDCTTHVGAIDRQRNMVSLTNTAVSLWGSRVVVKDTGILLNNGMIWFDPEPGKANSVGAGKRALVNMVPALGFRRGRPYFTLGAPGGRAIVSAIPQVIANLADGRGSMQAAVEAPRLHTEGGDVLVSTRVGAAALRGLERRGHSVVPKEETYSTLNFSRPVAIRVTPKGLEAGIEQYGAAAAAGD